MAMYRWSAKLRSNFLLTELQANLCIEKLSYQVYPQLFRLCLPTTMCPWSARPPYGPTSCWRTRRMPPPPRSPAIYLQGYSSFRISSWRTSGQDPYSDPTLKNRIRIRIRSQRKIKYIALLPNN